MYILYKKTIIISAIMIFFQNTVFANSLYNNVPVNANFGGSLLNHDTMMLKEKKRLNEIKTDFENFQERKNNKNKIEPVIEGDTGPGEKIYDAETLKNKQKQDSTNNTRKRHFFKRKKKDKSTDDVLINEVENKKKIIEKTDTTTTISASAEKSEIVDGKIFVRAVGVTNSKILSDMEIQSLIDDIIGKYVTFDELEDVIQNFNYTYASKGFVTARAFLPPQTVEDGIVRINLVEGTIGIIDVENNKYTSESYIKKRVSAKQGDIFQIVELEQDILKFNKYNDGIKLKANLNKGEKLGTTDIKIIAEEKFPFHVTAMMDNAGRKTIGELRGGVMAYSDSLFKQRDRFSVGAYISRHSVTPFADYNIPINKHDGKLGFMFSSSNAQIGEGPYKMFDISSHSYNYSLYYSHPLIRKPNFELTSYTALNYKQASTEFGDYNINTDKVTSFETALNARYDTKRGIWYISQGVYQAFPILSDASKYFKYTGSLIRLHDFGHGIVGQFKGMYQYSPQKVIPYIDQFQAGGLATIRGYSEGLLIGKSGYILSGEVLFPIAPQTITLKRKNEKRKIPFIGKYVKAVAFVDHAGIYPFKGEGPGAQSYNSNDYLVSMGLGLRINLPGDATARLYWGCPLLQNNHEQYKRNPRFSFELSLAPDFDKLLQFRKYKRKQEHL